MTSCIWIKTNPKQFSVPEYFREIDLQVTLRKINIYIYILCKHRANNYTNSRNSVSPRRISLLRRISCFTYANRVARPKRRVGLLHLTPTRVTKSKEGDSTRNARAENRVCTSHGSDSHARAYSTAIKILAAISQFARLY
jgi:hypothetical protein